MKLNIRPMSGNDKLAIMQILQDTPEFLPAEVVVAEEVIDSYLQDPSGSGYFVLVAEAESVLTGYMCHGPTPLTEGTWDLYWMATAPEHQGKGIGKALMAFAEEEIVQAGGRMAFIETSSKPEYERTRHFHYARGYELICQIADFYAPGDDKLILQKRFR